jgi:hypothetical protein
VGFYGVFWREKARFLGAKRAEKADYQEVLAARKSFVLVPARKTVKRASCLFSMVRMGNFLRNVFAFMRLAENGGRGCPYVA